MSATFDTDPHPGKPKILFIGWPNSPHTRSWIDLLTDSPLNVRLFGLPTLPPSDWAVRTYLLTSPGGHDPNWRKVLRHKYQEYYDMLAQRVARLPRIWSEEKALAKIIKAWRPDVIHTLGFDPASYLYLRVRENHGLQGLGRWIAQARGGPDLYLYRHSPDLLRQMTSVIHQCDYFIADNHWNYEFANSLGLRQTQLTPFGVVSGTGGMDIDLLRSAWQDPPSRRERIIYMPKAYENQAVKGLAAMEAIRLAWPRISPCKVILDWVVQPEMQMWIPACLGPEIMEHVQVNPLVPREQSLEHSCRARVMYAPSVLDGIPNSMLEAMCCGSFPIVSPLESIEGVVEDGRHVLMARNLYPEEMAQALIRAMEDDDLVDTAAAINPDRVREISDRNRFRAIAGDFYPSISGVKE